MRALVFFPLLLVLLSGGCTGLSRSLTTIQCESKVRNLPGNRPVFGGSLRLQCYVECPSWANIRPRIRFSWRHPDGTTSNGPYLIVNDLSGSKLGNYKCLATPDTFYQNSFKIFKIWDNNRDTYSFGRGSSLSGNDNAISPNVWNNNRGGYSVGADFVFMYPLPGEDIRIGGTINRNCGPPSSSHQSYDVTWILPNGQRIKGRTLTVNNLRRRDFGNYKCHAVNRRTGAFTETVLRFPGYDSSGLELSPFVTASRERILRNIATLWVTTLPDEDMRVGGTVSERCSVDRSGWEISWKYPSKVIYPGRDLRIPNLSRRDYGRYWCIARDPRTKQEIWGWFEMTARQGY